jgi:hypothetical protein
LSLFQARAADEDPQIVSEMKASEIFLGESVEYHVTLRNVKKPAAPDLSAFASDFTVASAGDRSLDQNMIYSINGQSWEQHTYGHLYGYRLTPKHAGRITVPAPVATVEGRKIAGQQLELRVIAPENQDAAILEIVPSKTKVYPTQPFEITLRVLLKPLPDDNKREPLAVLSEPPLLEINWQDAPDGLSSEDVSTWLNGLVTNTGHGFRLNNIGMRSNDLFSMFEQQRAAVFNLYTGRENRRGLDGHEAEYFVYELKRAFKPERAGVYQFGPATLKGHLMDGQPGHRYNARKLVVNAPPVTVEAKEVPVPRPPSFCGGIGNYQCIVSAQPLQARVGDPLTLTIEMRRQEGAGSVALLSAPDLSANGALAANFEIIDKAPLGEVTNQEQVKRFAYGLRAKKAGATIPALTITFFNPETGQFVDQTTQPVKLDIKAAAQMSSGEVVGALPTVVNSSIRRHEQGIFQNLTDVGELGDQSAHPVWYIAVAAAAWLGYALLGIFVLRHRRLAGDQVWQRRQRARAAALRQLREAEAALSAGKTAEALRLAREAFAGLIGDMLNLPPAGLTAPEAEQALAKAGLAPEARRPAIGLLEQIEASAYGSVAAQDAAGLLASAKKNLDDLYHALDAKK